MHDWWAIGISAVAMIGNGVVLWLNLKIRKTGKGS